MPFPDGTGMTEPPWTDGAPSFEPRPVQEAPAAPAPAESAGWPPGLAPAAFERHAPVALQGPGQHPAIKEVGPGMHLSTAAPPAEPATREHQAVLHQPGPLFLSDGLAEEELFWKVAATTGTWALSPGPGQVDVDRPLVLDDEMFASIKKAFDEGAFPHVTVPETHANNVLQNTGYVRKLEVLDKDDPRLPEEILAAYADAPDDTKLLMTGVEFTEPDVRERAKNGSIPDTSVGVKFNYRAKRTGATYPAALEHLSLTPVPWLDGNAGFTQGLSLSEPYDHQADGTPYDGVYLSMNVSVRTDEYDETKARKIIEALGPGDEWSWDYGVRVVRADGDGDAGPFVLYPGYGDALGSPEAPFATADVDKLMARVGGAVARCEARKARDRDREAKAVGYSQDPLPGDEPVGSLPGELTLSTETEQMPQTKPKTKTAAEILAEQQAKIDQLEARNAELEGSVQLSQSTNQVLLSQTHVANVKEKVGKLQAKAIPPAVLRRAQAIYLSDLTGTTGVAEGEGLNLSVQTPIVGEDGSQQVGELSLSSPTAIVDYLLEGLSLSGSNEAATLAALYQQLDAGAAEKGLALSVDGTGANDEAVKKAQVEAHERAKHPERFADNGKGDRL